LDQDLQPAAPEQSLVDLHTHSICSDGTLTPAELVQEAKRRGLKFLGLTDHDTVAGIAEASVEADRIGVTVIPGTELSAERNGREAHILGYFIDYKDDRLLHDLDEYASMRPVRIEKMVANLRDLGLNIELDRILEIAGPGTIGRPHVARGLVEQGYATDIADAFDKYLSAGRPAYVSRQKISAEEAIAVITRSGGVPVLAHPLSTKAVEETLAEFVPLGLKGLEADYSEYSPAQRDNLRRTAERWNLIATGGSDYHGPGVRVGRDLGGPFVPIESVERLQAAARQHETP
jgi:predicted metal-dependent phosphoesterase TrpH